MYLASVVLTQSSVQRQFLKQIKHSLRLGGCCPFFLLLLLHQLWRPYSCRRIGSETCSHWKLTLKEDLCLRASTCIKKGTEIGGWRRVEFGTDFSQHCTVKQAQTGCEIAEQMGSVKWYFSKAPSNFQLFFFFFPLTYFAAVTQTTASAHARTCWAVVQRSVATKQLWRQWAF